MIDDEELLPRIRSLLSARKYRIRIHAVRHMVEEGFTEHDIINSPRREKQNFGRLSRREPMPDRRLFSAERQSSLSTSCCL
jgi:hypothetical protein